jgi:uncharacterized protein (TIRG00374 family)
MKKYSRLWLILILSVLTIFALVRLGNIDISTKTLTRVNWGWFSLVVISYYTSIVARGWRWRHILKTMGWPVNFVYAATLLVAGLFLSAILPARAGDIGRVAMLKQDHKVPIAQGIASIASERVLDVFAILTMAILGAWLALPGRIPPEVLQLMIGVGLLFVVGLIGLLVVPGIEKWLRECKPLRALIPARIWSIYQKILDFGFSLIHGVRMLGQKPRALIVAVGQSFFIWIWDALMIYFTLGSLGLIAPFSISLFTAMVSDLVTAVPVTPGALGQFDAALISLLSLFGLSASDTSLATLLFRFIQLWTFIPISALVTYIFGFSRALKLSKTKTVSGQAPATPPPSLAES